MISNCAKIQDRKARIFQHRINKENGKLRGINSEYNAFVSDDDFMLIPLDKFFCPECKTLTFKRHSPCNDGR